MPTRRFLQSSLVAAALALHAASARSDTVPPCSAIEARPPAASAVCDDRELAVYTESLSDRIVAHNSRALVRITYDDRSRVQSVCVDDHTGRDVWNARRHVAEQLLAMGTIPDGPPCVAGKRVDLNRYEAKLAETKSAIVACSVRMARRMKALPSCQKYRSDWILYDRVGSTRPYLYVRSEEAPAATRADETMRRCARTAWGFEAQSACIQADGFELLVPPQRG
jgi:hypothetical protein